MFKTRFNYKFKKIIALSTLAAIGCSSNLIQSMEVEQDPVDLILSLTQEDREKLLELMRNQKIAYGLTDFKTFKHPVYFKRISEVQNGANLDSDSEDEIAFAKDWIMLDISLEFDENKKATKFKLMKNTSTNHIYLLRNDEGCGVYWAYKKLKGTEWDPDKYEKKIWEKPKTFEGFWRKLLRFERFMLKLGIGPKTANRIKTGTLIATGLGAIYGITKLIKKRLATENSKDSNNITNQSPVVININNNRS